MYDTTDSFKNVTTVEYIFGYTGLLSIPYDSNSLRGIFSNCPNLSNANYCFAQNGYMTGEIPPTLFSNCSNITSLGYVFGSTTGLTGQISDQMFRGLPNLSQIGYFFKSTQISGEIPSTLFDENLMLYILQQFLTNTKISGTIPSDLFKNNPNVWNMACCFSLCTGVTAIGDNLFSHFNQLQWGQGCFYHTGIQELQPNLLGSGIETTAAQANIFEMFEYCEKLTRIPSTILLETILYHDARALFSNCRNISGYSDGATSLQILDDFKDGDDRFYENYMQTVLGMFAGGNKLPDIDTIPVELCGNGDRLFPNFHVGMILLNDLTRVEIKDFVYDSNNKPIGWIYDSDSTYDYCVCFNNLNKRQWIRTSILTNQYGSQIPSELLVGSINYQDLYDMFYNERHGDTYTDIWLNWDVYQNNKDDFPVLQDVEAYKIGTTNIKPYIPTIYELRIATTFNYWMQMATDKIVNSSGGDFTSSNCYSISTWGATQTSCLANNSMSLTRTENGLNVYTALYYSNQNYRPFFKVEKN